MGSLGGPQNDLKWHLMTLNGLTWPHILVKYYPVKPDSRSLILKIHFFKKSLIFGVVMPLSSDFSYRAALSHKAILIEKKILFRMSIVTAIRPHQAMVKFILFSKKVNVWRKFMVFQKFFLLKRISIKSYIRWWHQK